MLDEKSIKEAKSKRLYYQKQLREHLKQYPQLRREYNREKVRIPLENTDRNDKIELTNNEEYAVRSHVSRSLSFYDSKNGSFFVSTH